MTITDQLQAELVACPQIIDSVNDLPASWGRTPSRSTSHRLRSPRRPSGGRSAEGGYMIVSKVAGVQDSRLLYESALADVRQDIADKRAKADELVATDGGLDARRQAKGIRISASHFERRIAELVATMDAIRSQRAAVHLLPAVGLVLGDADIGQPGCIV